MNQADLDLSQVAEATRNAMEIAKSLGFEGDELREKASAIVEKIIGVNPLGLIGKRNEVEDGVVTSNTEEAKEDKFIGVSKGISYNPFRNTWRAVISSGSKSYHLGIFDREADARTVYKTACENVAKGTLQEWFEKWREKRVGILNARRAKVACASLGEEASDVVVEAL